MADHVKALYENSRTSELDVVAFKGGHVERDLLTRLPIPFIDLEEYGCPKIEKLVVHKGLDADQIGCGKHRGLFTLFHDGVLAVLVVDDGQSRRAIREIASEL